MTVVDGKYENKQLWSYSDAVKTDNRAAQADIEFEAAKEFISLDERIIAKLE